MSRSSTKTMLIVFFDIRSIVHREFVPQGQIVNKKFYCEVLLRLRENIRRKRSDLWRAKNWILHDDNAPCHRALLFCEFLANHNMLSLPHPPYSLDLALADFFLFPKMKMQLKGRRFHSVADIQCESQKVMDSLTQNDFKAAFQQWQERCDQCIAAQGDYFEDGVQT
jgi:histone-lysine N-methyltransferase SETMAR